MVRRREAIAGVGATLAGGLAGCTGFLDDTSSSGDGTTDALATSSGGGGQSSPTPTEMDFSGASWPTFGGGPRRRGRARDGTGPEAGGTVTWTTTVGDVAVYGPVVAGNTVFAAAGSRVAAHAAADGSTRWERTGWTQANTPTFAGDALYVPNDGSGLAVLDPVSGETRWSLDAEGVVASPTVQDGTLYGVSPGRGVLEVDTESRERTGTIRTDTGHAIAVDGDALYVRGQEALLVVEDAEVATRVGLPPAQAGYPVVGDGLVYVATCGDREALVAVDPTSGETQWSRDTSVSCGLSGVVNPALADDVLVWAAGETVAALDPASGDEAWTTTLDSPRGVAVGGDTAYVAQSDGSLVALALDAGDERWRVSVQREDGVGTDQPMVVGDRVYHHVGKRLAAVDPA